jgi:hypothetical protein
MNALGGHAYYVGQHLILRCKQSTIISRTIYLMLLFSCCQPLDNEDAEPPLELSEFELEDHDDDSRSEFYQPPELITDLQKPKTYAKDLRQRRSRAVHNGQDTWP